MSPKYVSNRKGEIVSLFIRRRTDIRSEEGSVLVLTAVMMIVMTGFVGLAIDSGSFYLHKRSLQTAADAGALQGGHELHRGHPSLVTAAALTGATENGYSHGTDGVVVEVYTPPVTGFYVGDTAAIEVVVRQPSPVTFMAMFGVTPPTIPARAVAWAGVNSKTCVHILEDSAGNAFDTQSSHAFNAPNGSGLASERVCQGSDLSPFQRPK